MRAHEEPSALPTAFRDVWRNFGNLSSRVTRTAVGNFLLANVLLLIPLNIVFAAAGSILKLAAMFTMIAIWFPLPALIIRRLNDAGLPRLLVLVPMCFVACVVAFPFFGFNVETDLVAGDYWIESKFAEILMVGSLGLLLAKPAGENRFGPNPRYDAA